MRCGLHSSVSALIRSWALVRAIRAGFDGAAMQGDVGDRGEIAGWIPLRLCRSARVPSTGVTAGTAGMGYRGRVAGKASCQGSAGNPPQIPTSLPAERLRFSSGENAAKETRSPRADPTRYRGSAARKAKALSSPSQGLTHDRQGAGLARGGPQIGGWTDLGRAFSLA